MLTTARNGATTAKVMALGLLLAALMTASFVLAEGRARASTTFTVTNTNGTGAGSLRRAILDANAASGADAIKFAIPGSDVKTIAPESALPEITEALTINGYSQPGAQPNQKAVGSDAVLKIELSGSSAPDTSGLRIGASNSTIKGLVINGWGYDGITIGGDNATGNRVVGNYIGTDKSGTAPLGNSFYGVYILGANNTVGGTEAGTRNVISANGLDGVVIADGTGNRILSNSIFSNGRFGIDLDGDAAATPNDPGDADTGANNLQNKPVLSSAKTGSTTTTVRGKLNSAPNRTFKVQFFSNPSGTDEGKKLIGYRSVTTDGSGNATFAFSPARKVALGRTITATATSPGGDTSEFSAPRTVVSA